jgi:PAS domain S-box-containing protein
MLLMLAAATALRGVLDPVLGDRAPFITYYPLTVFLALFAGPAPAAVSVALSAILSGLFFGAAGSIRADVVALSIYVPANAVLIVLIERVRRAGGAARRSETAAAAQRAVLETALESVDAGVHSWDPDTGRAEWDVRLRTMFGFGPMEPATYEALMARVHPVDRPRVERAVLDAMLPDGPRRYTVEFRLVRPDGEVRWISSTGFSIFEHGRLVRVVGTARNVTERRRVEAVLRESEQRFATLAEGSPVLLWFNGLEGSEFVNRAYREFVGVDSDDEVRGYDWSRFLHPDDRDDYVNAYKRAFAMQVQFTAEFRFRRSDGEYRRMRSEATPRFGDEGELVGYVGATFDVTERRNAEDALRAADRPASATVGPTIAKRPAARASTTI